MKKKINKRLSAMFLKVCRLKGMAVVDMRHALSPLAQNMIRQAYLQGVYDTLINQKVIHNEEIQED